MSQNAVFGSIPDAVFFLEGTALSSPTPVVMQLPEAGASPAPSDIRAVAGFVISGAPPSPTVVVSEGDHAQNAVAVSQGNFTWSTVRATGDVWSSQAAADITGDGNADFVGYAGYGAGDAQICAIDGAAGTTPTCFQTPFGMDGAGLAIGAVVAPGQDDLILTSVNPQNQAMTGVFLVPNVRIATGSVMADNGGAPTDFAVQDASFAIAQLDGAGKEIILVGRDGTFVCARATSQMPPAIVACQ
jgi:hypothetical protein